VKGTDELAIAGSVHGLNAWVLYALVLVAEQ
jgi:hypothetical protein